MRLVSWNVNGLRAILKKDFASCFSAFDADIVCLQETKAQVSQVEQALSEHPEFSSYFDPDNTHTLLANSAVKKGYSSTVILSRQPPISVVNDIGITEHDQEGRVIRVEFEAFYLVTVYTPNSGSELKRLEYRQAWDLAFLEYLKVLEQTKPVVVCGDLNVAHRDIDLARPKQNYDKSPGYMQAEIDGLDQLIEAGFVDTFRDQHPDTIKYSWWSYRAGARARNVGWRIDYFLVSEGLKSSVVAADILTEVVGSDHCPVLLEISNP